MKRTLLAIAIGAISTGLAAGVLAQEGDTEPNDEVTANEEQAAEPGDAQEEVSVSEEELPDEGTESEDYEALDGGDDTADSDTTESGDETSSEANDATETQTEPAAEQAEQAPQAGQADERDTEAGFEEMGPAGVALDACIASLQVSEVEGMTVVNVEGETLGQVEKVLRHNDAGDLHTVVAVGGIWIFGGSDVALPLANMRLEGEQLVLQDTVGEDELDELATDYDEDRYSEVDGDLTLSDAMGS